MKKTNILNYLLFGLAVIGLEFFHMSLRQDVLSSIYLAQQTSLPPASLIALSRTFTPEPVPTPPPPAPLPPPPPKIQKPAPKKTPARPSAPLPPPSAPVYFDIFRNIRPDGEMSFIETLRKRKDFLDWEKQYGITVQDGIQDSESDGLSDEIEFLAGTNPLKIDSDGDGFSDSDEVLGYNTNPNDPADPGTLEKLGVRITGFIENQQVTDHQPFMKGAAPKNSEVEIVTRDLSGKEKILGKGAVSENSLYVFQIGEPLPDGPYQLTARTVEEGEKLVSSLISIAHALSQTQQQTLVSAPVNIRINSTFDVPVPDPKKLAGEPISSDDILKNVRIVIKDNQPVLVGKAGYNNEVIANWSSIVVLSALIADSTVGDFSIQPPKLLPPGPHDVYIQAVRPSDSALSKTVKISFNISEAGTVEPPAANLSSETSATQQQIETPLKPAAGEQAEPPAPFDFGKFIAQNYLAAVLLGIAAAVLLVVLVVRHFVKRGKNNLEGL